jgi:hypothetical protein
VDRELFRQLLTPTGQDLLAQAAAAYDERSAVDLASRLRRSYPGDLVAAALTQVALRRQARAKFGEEADRLFFTREGLEQATPAPVATYRASRIMAALRASDTDDGDTVESDTVESDTVESDTVEAGVDAAAEALQSGTDADVPHAARVVDLCCGVGGDLLALARSGLSVTGVDQDPLTVEIARANLAACDLTDRARVELGDATTFDRSGYAGAVADPARRSARGRAVNPADYSPPWWFVEELLRGTACVKTAPTLPHELIADHVEAEWISYRGEVKEVALWSGAFRRPVGVRRRATVLSDETSVTTLTDADDPGSAPVSDPLAYLYEPDNAVIRSRLVTGLAARIDGALLHPRIAYLTSTELRHTTLARAYRIQEVLPYDIKAVRRALRQREAGTVTVKTRGLDLDPEAFRKRLGARGPHHVTLVATRTQRRGVVLVVEPVSTSETAH